MPSNSLRGAHPEGGHRSGRSAMVMLLLAVLLVAANASAAVATSPGPVIPIGSVVTEGVEEAQDEQPDDDPGCLAGGSSTAVAQGRSTASAPFVLASYPNPVIPIGSIVPAQKDGPCRTELSLSLTVESRKGQDPDGADASLEELLVPRDTLESGFQTTMVAGDRTITLSDPGDEWKVKQVDCSCGGGGTASVPLGQLAVYSQPVIPIAGGASPGGVSCGQPSSAPATAGIGTSTMSSATGLLTAYPGPVIPIGSVRVKTPPEPETPARQPGSVSWSSDGTIRIHDAEQAGAVVSCRWIVEHAYGHVKMRTITEPAGREGKFSYVVSPDTVERGRYAVNLRGSASGDEAKVLHGGWTAELSELRKTWKLKDSSCKETDSETGSSAQGTTADLGVEPGDRVECTFKLKLLAPKPGRWNSRSGKMRVACPGLKDSFPPLTEAGTIKVRDDGMRLIARGFDGDSVTWTLHRASEEDPRYSGRQTMNYQGARGTFHLDVTMVNEEKLVGTFRGRAKTHGVTCTFDRPVTLTYAGG